MPALIPRFLQPLVASAIQTHFRFLRRMPSVTCSPRKLGRPFGPPAALGEVCGKIRLRRRLWSWDPLLLLLMQWAVRQGNRPWISAACCLPWPPAALLAPVIVRGELLDDDPWSVNLQTDLNCSPWKPQDPEKVCTPNNTSQGTMCFFWPKI